MNFLDLTISIDEGKISYDIYRRPTHTDIVIHNESKHHPKHKNAAFHFMVNRLLNTPLSEESYDKELRIVKTIAKNNGFKTTLVDRILRQKLLKQHTETITTLSNLSVNEKKKWKTFAYHGKVTNGIAAILRNNEENSFNAAFSQKNTIGRLLLNNKGPHT